MGTEIKINKTKSEFKYSNKQKSSKWLVKEKSIKKKNKKVMLNINKKSELNCALKALIFKSDKNKNVKIKNKKKRGSAASALAKLRLIKLLSCPLERSDE